MAANTETSMFGKVENGRRDAERPELCQTQNGSLQRNFPKRDVVPDAVDIPAGVTVVELSFSMAGGGTAKLPGRVS